MSEGATDQLFRLPWASSDTWLVGVTVVLVVATVALWLATKALVRDARTTSEADLRAYVSFELATIGPVIPGNPIAYTVQLRNVGKTPAHRVRCWTGIALTEFPNIRPTFDKPDQSFSGTTGPNQMVAMAGCLETLPDQAFIVALGSRTAGIILWGNVVYSDIYGRTRETPFKLFHGGLQPPDPGSLWKTPDGNDAT